jgi:predicted nucleotidyltransferase
MPARITFNPHELREFCQKWQIVEFALFGSALRDDFGPDSDVDVLVTFDEKATWSLLDIVTIQDELSQIVSRPVDIVEKKAIRNPFRRARILSTCEIIHAA